MALKPSYKRRWSKTMVHGGDIIVIIIIIIISSGRRAARRRRVIDFGACHAHFY